MWGAPTSPSSGLASGSRKIQGWDMLRPNFFVPFCDSITPSISTEQPMVDN